MAFFSNGRDVPGADPTVMEKEAADPFENLLKLPVAPAAQTATATTVIAYGMTVTGSIKGEGNIKLEGRWVGEIDMKGSVLVTKTGEIRGPVTTDTIEVAGRVGGNITARRQLRLEVNGSIDGDISAAALTIENGGSFNGRSTMLKPSVSMQMERDRERDQARAQPAQQFQQEEKPNRQVLLDEDDEDDDFPSMPRRDR